MVDGVTRKCVVCGDVDSHPCYGDRCEDCWVDGIRCHADLQTVSPSILTNPDSRIPRWSPGYPERVWGRGGTSHRKWKRKGHDGAGRDD